MQILIKWLHRQSHHSTTTVIDVSGCLVKVISIIDAGIFVLNLYYLNLPVTITLVIDFNRSNLNRLWFDRPTIKPNKYMFCLSFAYI